MTHGWPGSVVEFLDVIGPLADPAAHGGDAADAFHVVCPSLPGYGFSDKPSEPGWDLDRIADAWAALMARLGYDRYGAQGGDWGGAVSTLLGHRDRDHVLGVHTNMAMVGPDPETMNDLTEYEQRSLADMGEMFEWGIGYAVEQGTRPQTVGYGLVDSPVGQAAWIAEKCWAWTDHDGDPTSALSRDQMLDNITLYWLTKTAASSARLYWESGWSRPSGRSHMASAPTIDTPTGISIFPREIMRPSRRWCERRYSDIRFYDQPERGGHFAAWEQPALFVDQVRRAFRTMR
jgi:pimeloyl-ACP methyl ester carboxylesterase